MAVSAFDPGRVRISWRRAALVSLAVLVIAGVAVALVGGGPGRRSSSDLAAVPTDAGVGADEVARSTVSAAAPSIVRTARLQVRVGGSFAVAVERTTDVATAAGGFVATSTTSFEKGRGSAELTLRVPAVRFDEVRRSLAGLGSLRSAEIGGSDVGGQLVDLEARLRTLRAEEGALDTLLGRAADIGQILQIRDRLTGIRTEIEQLSGRQAALEGQVALATITVSLQQAGSTAAKVEISEDVPVIVTSFRTAVGAMVAVVGGMLVVLGAALPFASLALVGWLGYRRFGRRATPVT